MSSYIDHHWRAEDFTIAFVDNSQLVKFTKIGCDIAYPDFLAVLHELTTEEAHKIPGLPIDLEVGEGLSLRDGSWYCRFVHAGKLVNYTYNDNTQSWDPVLKPIDIQPWIIVNSPAVFEGMMRAFINERSDRGSHIEFQHQLQKDRDDGILPTPFRRNGPVCVGSSSPPEQKYETEQWGAPGPTAVQTPNTSHQNELEHQKIISTQSPPPTPPPPSLPSPPPRLPARPPTPAHMRSTNWRVRDTAVASKEQGSGTKSKANGRKGQLKGQYKKRKK